MAASALNTRLRTLIDTIPVSVWMSDEDGSCYNFNKKWLSFRGRSAEEEAGSGWLDGIHENDTARFLLTFRTAHAEKKSFETDVRLRHADGTYRWVRIAGEPDYEEERFCGFVGTCSDLGRKEEQDTRGSNEAPSRLGGWEYDSGSHRIRWSREIYHIFELDPEKHAMVTPEQAIAFCHEDDREPLRTYVRELIQTGRAFHADIRIVTRTGNLKWVRLLASCVPGEVGQQRVVGAMQDVTEQRNADLALIESERKLHFVLDGLPVAVYLTDVKGEITNFNKAAEDIWGRKPQKQAGGWDGSHRLYDSSGARIPSDESPMARAVRQNCVIHGEEIISECDKGSRTNVLAFSTPYRNTKGETEGALNVLVDITERKQLEEKLITLSLVARKTSNAVIISDARARITWVNQSFTRISGYTMQEALGKRPSDFLHCEETSKETVEYVYRNLERQQPVRFEILNRGKNGNKYWLDVDVQPLLDNKGNVSGYISVETDITELKYIQEELKKSENKLRAILDSTSDDNVIVDPDYKIISFNKAASEHLDRAYGKPPAAGELIWNYVPQELRSEFEQTFNQAVAGFMSKSEKLLPVRQGKSMWFEFRFYPVYASDGSIIGVAINSKNIHAKKLADLRVQQQNRKLKEIAFTQSHTLRRPVANIMGLWNLICQSGVIEEHAELQELMNYMGRSVSEMDKVIREITRNTGSL